VLEWIEHRGKLDTVPEQLKKRTKKKYELKLKKTKIQPTQSNISIQLFIT